MTFTLPPLIDWAALAHEASQTILAIGPDKIVKKADGSPVTAADVAAHTIINTALTQWTPSIPVLSEEGEHFDSTTRAQWERFWCVDPLDGTQSFINGSGDFCINIGLIEQGQPTFGVLALPKKGLVYIGGPLLGKVWRGELGAGSDFTPLAPPPSPEPTPPTIATSLHIGTTMEAYLAQLQAQTNSTPAVKPASGAVKFCHLLEGLAHRYPRFGPCSWWDTAAGHALVLTHGFDIYTLPDTPQTTHDFTPGAPLRYDGASLKNPAFVCQHSGRH